MLGQKADYGEERHVSAAKERVRVREESLPVEMLSSDAAAV